MQCEILSLIVIGLQLILLGYVIGYVLGGKGRPF